jgi:hypothetical protein
MFHTNFIYNSTIDAHNLFIIFHVPFTVNTNRMLTVGVSYYVVKKVLGDNFLSAGYLT